MVLVALPSQHQREAAVVGKAVEQPPARVLGGGGTVLALIEEQAGLLPVTHIDVVVDAELGDRDRLGHVAGEHVHTLLEPLERPYLGIVARENAPAAPADRSALKR